MTDMLRLSAHLPEIEFAPGATILEEGGAAGAIWVLVQHDGEDQAIRVS